MTIPRDASILIVDDEPTVQALLTRVLTRGGYENLFVASSADQAREYLQNESFDVVLSDMQMPGGSGIDLIAYLRHTYPDVATLMVTGTDDAKLADQALALGAYGYIIKPFRSTEVLIGVSNALRRRDLELDNKKHRDELEERVKERTADLWDAVLRLERAEQDLRSSRADTIQRLAIAAELRDEETGRHVARMSRYCELVAKAVGMDPEVSSIMREASSLHDVGKIGVPDGILLKPRSLDDQEMVLMREHAVIGHRILHGSDSPLLQLAATIALTHHEWFDGNGYPNGLVGEDIPLPGRIAAIADVFDALTSNRVYRRAYSVGVAVEMMKQEAGQHFDPDLLDVFWTVLPEVLKVSQELGAEEIRPKHSRRTGPNEHAVLR